MPQLTLLNLLPVHLLMLLFKPMLMQMNLQAMQLMLRSLPTTLLKTLLAQ